MSKSKYALLALTTALLGTSAMAESPWQIRGRVLGVFPSVGVIASFAGALSVLGIFALMCVGAAVMAVKLEEVQSD